MSKTSIIIVIVVVVVIIAGIWWYVSSSQHSTSLVPTQKNTSVNSNQTVNSSGTSTTNQVVTPPATTPTTQPSTTANLLNNPSALNCGSTSSSMNSSESEVKIDTVLACFGARITQCQPTIIIMKGSGGVPDITVGIGTINSQCAISMRDNTGKTINCPSISEAIKSGNPTQNFSGQPAEYAAQAIFSSEFYGLSSNNDCKNSN